MSERELKVTANVAIDFTMLIEEGAPGYSKDDAVLRESCVQAIVEDIEDLLTGDPLVRESVINLSVVGAPLAV